MTASEWFNEARFGMFVHFGHSSQRGIELSWPLTGLPSLAGLPLAKIGVDDYHATADTFCPEPGAPKRWAEAAADAGMGYAVLTAKHHDGFALWPTTQTDWSIARSPYPGDLVGEFVVACREAGLRVGLYLSLPDWHHPDYPAFREAMKPYLFIAYPRPDPPAWERYLQVLFGQVEELLTSYGPIDLLWFDGGWERSAGEWRAGELEGLIRGLQPEILLNDRLPGVGDYDTPEQFVPPSPPPRPWEVCLTMNNTWGYDPADDDYKSEAELVHTLCEVSGRGGNLLLNVSPAADGSIPTPQQERLARLGAWMAGHGNAIRGSRAGLEPWQFYGPSTTKPGRLFLFLPWRPTGPVTVRGVPLGQLQGVRHLSSGEPLSNRTRRSVIDALTDNPAAVGQLSFEVPEELIDPVATVVEVGLTP